jgi:Helix-turn-helix domain
MTLSSVVFRNMSSEPKPQPTPRPGAGARKAEGAGARRADPARDAAPGAAALGRAIGYDPDDPATWPGSRPAALVEPAAVAPAVAEPAAVEPADLDGVTLTDAKAMRALAHPLRMAIIELFSVRETLTATQVSESLGESPANCAFHLRTLAKYGFVREAGGGRGRERPWALVNRTISLTTKQPDPQTAVAAGELGRLWLERWIERARRVHGSPAVVPGWEEATGWSNSHVFLTPEEATRLGREMRRMLKRYEGRLTDPALRPEGALPVEWTIFASVVPELAERAHRGPGPDDPGANGPGGPEGTDAGDEQ